MSRTLVGTLRVRKERPFNNNSKQTFVYCFLSFGFCMLIREGLPSSLLPYMVILGDRKWLEEARAEVDRIDGSLLGL